MKPTTILAFGCAAGVACAGWWWLTSQEEEKSDIRSVPGARAEAEDADDEMALHCKHRIVAEPGPSCSQQSLAEPGIVRDIDRVKPPSPSRQALSADTTSTATHQKELPTENAQRSDRAANVEICAQADHAKTYASATGAGARNTIPAQAPAKLTLAGATEEWAALHAEGWRRAAVSAQNRASAAPKENVWISCRAARVAASKRSKDSPRQNAEIDQDEGVAIDNDVEYNHGVWSIEDEDRYSGAGGRGAICLVCCFHMPIICIKYRAVLVSPMIIILKFEITIP